MTAKNEKVVRTLIEQARSLTERARSIDEQTLELERKLRQVRGTRDLKRPASAGEYHVGDEGPTADLMSVVRLAITEHPLTFQELLDATGARPNRIKGVIMRLQREGVRVVNLGTEQRAVWFAPSEEVWKRLLKVRRLAR